MQEILKTDVLIIGTGIAGSTAAIKLANSGFKVTILTRAKELFESNTYYAQGGIIFKGKENDSSEKLSLDIMKAGAHINDKRAVEILSEEGPKLVQEFLIDKLGIEFDSHDGVLDRAKEGGHSVGRVIHHKDETGKLIENHLIRAISDNQNITILNESTIVDLIVQDEECIGASILDQKSENIISYFSNQVILATGGLGQIYEFTTNPNGARGDGIAIANQAGAEIQNLEYIQFHPTCFFHPDSPRFLITEAARGEGAKLVDSNGIPFMEKYDRNEDLATRDVISRAIYHEMKLTGQQNVFLDLKSYISKEKILNHFPGIHNELLKFNIDITKDLIPVVPAAHYACGGVKSDPETGESTLKSLYAIGEVACTGLHGANRLASTSLLEGLVWGNRSAESIINMNTNSNIKDQMAQNSKKINFGDEPNPELVTHYTKLIKKIMWEKVGIERNKEDLEKAKNELTNLQVRIEEFYTNSKVTDELIGLRNLVTTSLLVTVAALSNEKSLGCHFRIN